MTGALVDERWSPVNMGDNNEDRRFFIILWLTLGIFLLFGLVIPMLKITPPEMPISQEADRRVAKLLFKEKPPPPVPEKKPVPREEIKPPPPKPRPVEKKENKINAARKKAAQSGLLVMKDELAALQHNAVIESLQKKRQLVSAAEIQQEKPSSPSLLDANVTRVEQTVDNQIERSKLTDVVLDDRQVTQIDSSDMALAEQSSATKAVRTLEEIQRVMDSNKGKLNALYNRALRRNPLLAGQLMLHITIAPDGRVLACEIISSELASPELEKKLLNRILLFRFPEREVPEITINYPIEFHPR